MEAGKEKYKGNWEMEEVGWEGEEEEGEAEWEAGEEEEGHTQVRLQDFWASQDTQEDSWNQPGAGRRTWR